MIRNLSDLTRHHVWVLCAALIVGFSAIGPAQAQEVTADPSEIAQIGAEPSGGESPSEETSATQKTISSLADLTPDEKKYLDEWLDTAERAEEAIQSDRASTAAFEDLRAQIVEYRRAFEEARTQNASRIETLQSQLDALGPAPESGDSEPSDIALLRENLTDRKNTLRVPVVVSHEAYNRADGLIGEIDRVIRERQTQALLSRTPTPASPVLWPAALRSAQNAISDIVNETALAWTKARERKQIRSVAPQVLIVSALGLLFLLQGRVWAERIGTYFRSFGGRGSGVWGFLISLGRIGLPLIGVTLLSYAILLAGVLGLRGELILQALPGWAATLLGFMWLGDRLYPRNDEDQPFPVFSQNRGIARRNMLAIGVSLVLHDAVSVFEQIENISFSSRSVIGFPTIVLAGLVLLRLRQVIRKELKMREEAGTEVVPRTGLRRIGPFLRRAALLVAVGSTILALVGYGTMAEALIFPFLWTIGIFGLVLLLQRFFGDLYAWLSGKGKSADESVFPVLVGFLLVLMALPPLALVWGARVTDLTELWEQFLVGVSVGGTQISPVDFLTFAVVFSVGYSATRLFQGALASNLLPKTKLDIGGQNAVVSGIGYVGIFLVTIVSISMAGIDLSALGYVAGALSVGIGFGLQNIVSNFVSGIILLIERPISKNDWIEVGGNMGYVRDISVRSTRIETFDRTDVIIPNADLISGTVTNFTRGNTIGRVIIPVGVAYGTESRLVESILRELAEAHPMILSHPPPSVVFQGFGADSLDFEIRAILRDVNWMLSVKSDINHAINQRFTEEGIEIPFGQRDIWIRNPEAIAQATAAAGGQMPRPDASDPGPSQAPQKDDLGMTGQEDSDDD